MLASIKRSKSKFAPLLMAFLFLGTQLASTLAISIVSTPTAEATPICVIDTVGANDESGQKDLTRLCVDYAGAPSTVATLWNWDETGTNGANTMDACNLFDTDGDGNINYAVCVTTNSDPAVLQSTTTYSCGDTKIDRCTSTAAIISSGTTSCAVSQQNTDPFPTGTSSPKDTQGACTIQLSTVGGAGAKLIDVCSYPSAQPNSDPSDCVIARNNAGKLEVIKNLIPNNNAGLFNLQIDAVTKAPNVGHNGTTGEIVYSTGNHTVGETAGTSTSLAGYSTTIVCKDLNGTGAIVAQATNTSVSVPLVDDADVICTVTNTAAGSITIVKDAIANSLQDFGFTTTGTGVSNFTLDDDSGVAGADVTNANTKVFNNISAGTYTFTEASVNGWYLDSINCPNIEETQNLGARAVSLTVTAGQNITCTFTNRQLGQIKVTKQTDPNNDPTQFAISASPSAGVVGNANQNIIDNQTVVYTVKHGTYVVTETVPNGWTETSNNCSNLVINGNTPLVNGVPTLTCTINNTKLSTLTIFKDAQPNVPGIFNFTTTGTGLASFSLDDDPATAGTTNQKQFTGLLPGAYAVTEEALAGWKLDGYTCNSAYSNVATTTVGVQLSAGQNVECTFTNIKYGSISGYKFNDLNGNGKWDTNEPALGQWAIFIDKNNNGTYEAGQDVLITTNQDGLFVFENLLPGNYSIFEQIQTGWVQTLAPPALTLPAGQELTNANFGNQGKGTVKVIKNVDSDGDGDVDIFNDKSWTWDINGTNDADDATNIATSTVKNVSAGTYTIIEDQKPGYHLASVDCGSFQQISQSESINISVQPGQNVECTFTNARDIGTITVVKRTLPGNDPQDFNFTLNEYYEEELTLDSQSNFSGSELVNEVWNLESFVLDTDDDETLSDTEVVSGLPTGLYIIEEQLAEGWDLDDIWCDYGDQDPRGYGHENGWVIDLTRGVDITCYFTNVKRGSVTIVKDSRPNSDQEFSFEHNLTGVESENFALVDDGENTEASSKTFTNVLPGSYGITEIDTKNWREANFSCDNENEEIELFTNELISEEWFENRIFVGPGQNVTCTFVNESLALNITKTNNKPQPTVVGDTVIYTLTVTVPEEASGVTDATVIDLPPENFQYVAGSWTANSSVRGNIKGSTTTEPTYASPGKWLLGNLVGGEVVTLTYIAKILSNVTPGIYPDIAFVSGFAGDQEVLGNVTTADTPFVGTTVAVINPAVGKIFTAPLLANTGRGLNVLSAIIPALLIGLTLIAYRRSRQYPKKGGQL